MAAPSERRDQMQVNGLAAESAAAGDSPLLHQQPGHPIDCSPAFELNRSAGRARQDDRGETVYHGAKRAVQAEWAASPLRHPRKPPLVLLDSLLPCTEAR